MTRTPFSLTSFENCQGFPLKETLFDFDTGTLVPLEEIEEFPSSVQVALHEKAVELCGFERLFETAEARKKRKEELGNS